MWKTWVGHIQVKLEAEVEEGCVKVVNDDGVVDDVQSVELIRLA